ncbi:HET-domain-containing protein [Hypoxylon sp. FL1284]|nr:HET-domain-containing protein [Hypoxylon sp. FL1284]
MKAYARDEAPYYVAISYCWGLDSETDFVYVNDRHLPSRPNVFRLLLHLRFHYRECPEWRYFWIDAICIDQHTDEEKTAQVRRIDLTFRKAMTTAAWIGMPDDPENNEMRETDNGHKLSGLTLDDKIIGSSFWSRVWIVQELILSKDVVLLYGRSRRRWTWGWKIRQAFYRVWSLDGRYNAFANMGLLGFGARNIRNRGRNLGELMNFLERSEATDARDRVFALLGLVEPDERRLLGTVFPDYTMSHEKVMLITMAYLREFYAWRYWAWVLTTLHSERATKRWKLLKPIIKSPFRPLALQSAVKPQWLLDSDIFGSKVLRPRIFGLDRQTGEVLWSETKGYDARHSLVFSSVFHLGGWWESRDAWQLRLERRQQWFEARADALRRLANESTR